MLIEDPPPVTCRLAEREAYEERLTQFRRMGAVIVGPKGGETRASYRSRTWVFGLPPGDLNLTYLKSLAKMAGMLHDETHPDFTYRWRGREPRDLMDVMAFHGDVMSYHLQQLCKHKGSIVSRRVAIAKEIEVWRRCVETLSQRK